MLLPLLAAALAAEPTSWSGQPVAVDLHPVVFDYGARYQVLLANGMGGPKASAVFGPVVAEADVHWRLLEATGNGLPMDVSTAEKWRDTAVAGSFVAMEGLIDETFRRAPQLRVVQLLADSVVNPSVEVKRTNGRLRLDHPTGTVRKDLERMEAEIADLPWRRPNASVRWGLDWKLKDVDAPEEAPLLSWGAWLSTHRTFLSQLRADVALTDLEWSVSGREQVYPRVYLTGAARSVVVERGKRDPLGVPDPGRLAGGLMWAIPWEEGWTIKLERIVSLEEDTTTWMVTFRGENHTPIPARVRPALGATDDGGLSLPAVQETKPNRVSTW